MLTTTIITYQQQEVNYEHYKMDVNVISGMAESHSRSVETLAKNGIHPPKSDVSLINLSSGRGNGGVCPELLLKGHHDRLFAVFLISRSSMKEINHG